MLQPTVLDHKADFLEFISLYHSFIVRPKADFTNSPLSLWQEGITGQVE